MVKQKNILVMNASTKGTNIVSAIHHLRIAEEHMDDIMRERPMSIMAKVFKRCKSRLQSMYIDIKTEPAFPDFIRQGISQELKSDIFAPDAIREKVALLNPDQREFIETAIDALLKGEKIEIGIQ